MKFSTLVRISYQQNDKHNKPTRPFHRSSIPVLKTWLLMSLEQMMEENNWQPSSRSPSPILEFQKHASLWVIPVRDGMGREVGRRGVQDGEHMYTRGGFMSMYG